MIFLSAQPDTFYFVWQLEIQLLNFQSFGIRPGDIHVIVGYDPLKGISSSFLDFNRTSGHLARIFFYPDTRIRQRYVPSIRPHIIRQHFLQYPELSAEAIFYHDADIVFTTRLPDFTPLLNDDIWYFSDARSYLNAEFIKSRGGNIFHEMCEVVDIDPGLVEKNDEHAGGAQTLLKKVDAGFWERIEEDCENLYCHLQDNKSRYKRSYLKEHAGYEEEYRYLQSWCSDMWALLWNGLKRATIRLSPELDFCWPYEPAHLWQQKTIFHNAGIMSAQRQRFFYKSLFTEKAPYEEDLSFVPEASLSYRYVQMIIGVAQHKRYDLKDATFVIPVRIDSDDRLENLSAVLRYIRKNFDTNVLVLEADSENRIPAELVPEGIDHLFIEDHSPIFYRQFYNNMLLGMAATPIVIKCDADIVVPPSQMNDAVNAVRYGDCRVSYPYEGIFTHVKGVLRSDFIRTLDVRSLWQYLPSYPSSQPSYGGCVIVDRATFLGTGVDNEAFNGWGFEDQEMSKRVKILGHSIYRAKGPLFHLHHPRGQHSFFYDEEERMNSYREYIRVCNMSAAELQVYLKSWENHKTYVQ
jgi:hypothetical protein